MSSINVMRDLRASGITQETAEALVISIEKIVDNRAATKADIDSLRAEMRQGFHDVNLAFAEQSKLFNKALNDHRYNTIFWLVGILAANGVAQWLLR